MGNVSSQPMPAAAGAYAATSSSTAGDIAGPGGFSSSNNHNSSSNGPASIAGSELDTGAAAADAAAEGAAGVDASTAAGRHRKRLMQLEAKLQRYMDSEDRRVKELTEGVLYELLPAALNVMLPHCEDPLQELDAERCRAVAGAALAVSSLMNAPPGFLEFLLCIPWRQLPLLYPAIKTPGQQPPEQLLAHLAVDEGERKRLVNMRIHPQLMKPVLDFLYKPERADSVPPLLRIRPAPEQQQQQQQPAGLAAAQAAAAAPPHSRPPGSHQAAAFTAGAELLDTAAALLDGATPVHCAALRGNPAQVDHLLYCGADPTLRTAAGELAVQLVPVCGRYSKETGKRQCHCLGPVEQEVWECRSRIARNLIARRCLLAFKVGLVSFLSLAWLCLLALVGLLMKDASLQRPTLQAHVRRRRQQRLADAYAGTCLLLTRMRQEASQGHAHLTAAKRRAGYRQHTAEPPQSSHSLGGSIGCCGTLHPPAAAGLPATGGAASPTGKQPSRPVQSPPGAAAAAAVRSGSARGNSVDASVLSGCGSCSSNEPVAPLTPYAAAEAAGNLSGCNRVLGGAGTPGLTAKQLQLQQQRCQDSTRDDSAAASRTADINSINTGSGSSNSSRVAGGAPEVQLQAPCEPEDKDCAIELAFKCYVKAVHALQSLDLQGGILPQLLADHPDVLAAGDGQAAAERQGGAVPAAARMAAAHAGAVQQQEQDQTQQQQLLVLEDEQAELYCCWAESVLLKFNACSCPGCTSLAVQAIRMAHIAAARLFGRMQKLQKQRPQCWRAVGQALSRVVYAHIALLCQTEAQVSPSKASMWRAQQCLQEWDRLAAAGLVGQAEANQDTQLVDALRMWAKTAESDLLIAEALLGSSLGPVTTLADALAAALLPAAAKPGASGEAGSAKDTRSEEPNSNVGGSSTSCLPLLARPVSAALLDQLQAARGLATCTSPAVKQLAAQVADATARELSAGACLKELLAARSTPSSSKGVAALADAIAAAEPFGSLAADVAAARVLHQQCCQRVEAAAKLQGVIDHVLHLTSSISTSGTGPGAAVCTAGAAGGVAGSKDGAVVGTLAGLPALQGFEAADWEQCMSMLEAAVEEAKDANINAVRGRKLVKELQAQLAAADATAALDACMARRPCGSAALKAAISKAEAAAAAIAGVGGVPSGSTSGPGSSSGSCTPHAGGAAGIGSSCGVFGEVLLTRLQAAKKRLEVERASEALHKASIVYKSLADLPKLEAAVLNARKVGAEELAPEEYRAASELRARLTSAARVKQQLDAALRGLAAATGADAAEAVESAIREAARWDDLLPGEASRAAEALEAWRASSVCEAKLSRALRDGASSAQLSRFISEAAAAGVKVAAARRILKLQQVLEAAMAAADEAYGASSCQYGQLAAKLEAAEQGGVAQAVLEPGRKLLEKLLACEARQALEAALKPHSDWSTNTRIAALRVALDKAEDVLGMAVPALIKQQQEQQQEQEQQQDDLVDAEHIADQQQQQQDQEHQLLSVPDSAQSNSGLNAADAAASADAGTLEPQAHGVRREQDHQQQLQQQQQQQRQQQQQQQQQHLSEQDQQQQQPAGSATKSTKASSMQRTDSTASSSAASDVSTAAATSSFLGVGSGCFGRSSVPDTGDVLSAVAELAVRAWQLLELHHKQLEEIDRERAEQERARRELRERERQERARLEAEKAERGKQERERAAAERRQARTKAAERSKSLAVVWGSSAGSSSANASASSRSGRPDSAGKREGGSTGIKRKGSMGSAALGNAAQQRPPTPTDSAADEGSSSGVQQQPKAMLSSPRPATAPVVTSCTTAALSGGAGRSGSAFLAAPGVAGDASAGLDQGLPQGTDTSLLAHVSQHMRCDSYDLTSKVLAMLGPDLHDEQLSSAVTEPWQQQQQLMQQQQQQRLRSSLKGGLAGSGSGSTLARFGRDASSTAAASAAGAFGGLEGLDLAGLHWQRQHHSEAGWQLQPAALDPLLPGLAPLHGPEAAQRGPGSHPATPRFGFVDLGGASWGQPSPTGATAVAASTAVPADSGPAVDLRASSEGQGLAAAAANSSSTGGSCAGSSAAGGIWGSALGLGLVEGSSTALPPLAPKGQLQQLSQQRLGRVQRSSTEDGSAGATSSSEALLMTRGGRPLQQHIPMRGVDNMLTGGVAPVMLPEVGSNVHAFGQQQQQQPPSLLAQGQLMSPGGQQHQLAALMQLPVGNSSSISEYGGYSSAAGDLAELKRPASTGGVLGGRPAWGSAQQHAAQPGTSGVAAAAAALGGVGPALGTTAEGVVPFAMGAAGLALHHQQQQHAAFLHQQQHQHQQQQLHLLQLQLQQQQQMQLQLQQEQQKAAVSSLLGQQGAFGTPGGMGHASGMVQVSAPAVVGGPVLLPAPSSGLSGQGLGQFSSSFAFGAPGLSAFSQGPAGVGSSAGGAAAAVQPFSSSKGGRGTEPGAVTADAGSPDAQPAAVGSGTDGRQQAAPVFDAVAQLPDDLGLTGSPPSPGPAGRLQDRT